MRYFYFLTLSLILWVSCKKWDKEEEIPSYIKVYSAKVETDFSTEGAATSNISDMWVNIDGNRQGTYEMPTTFPVLSTGRHTLMLRAGIKVNGIAASRSIYPFYNPIVIDTILTAGEVLKLDPIFSYKPETIFAWMESFQGNGFSLDRDTESDTTLYVLNDSTGNKYGKFTIDAIRQRFYYKSAEAYSLPKNGSDSYLEFDYRCDHPFTVGLLINKLQSSINTPILVLNPHPNTLNHVYVHLTPTVTDNLDAINFNVIIQSVLQDGYTEGNCEIDNLKLLHF